MKHILIILTSLLASSAFGQLINIPGAITNSFDKEFAGAKEVQWAQDSNLYAVSCIYEGHFTSLKYAPNGTMLRKTEEVHYSELPSEARKKIDTDYPSSMAEMVDKIWTEDSSFFLVKIEVEGKEFEIRVETNGEISVKEE